MRFNDRYELNKAEEHHEVCINDNKIPCTQKILDLL